MTAGLVLLALLVLACLPGILPSSYDRTRPPTRRPRHRKARP